MLAPDIVINHMKQKHGILSREYYSRCELEIYDTDIGIVYRYKFIKYHIGISNHVFYEYYYVHDGRWINLTHIRQRSARDEFYCKYIDDDTSPPIGLVPKTWNELLVNSYADPITYQVDETFPTQPIVLTNGVWKIE